MKPQGILSLLCAAALTVACSRDARNTVGTDRDNTDRDATVGTTGRTDIDNSDKDFVRDLTEAGNAEVQLGKLASDRGASPAVKQFGQMMVKDHTAAGDRLKQIATTHNVVPGDIPLSDEHSQLFQKLSQLRGAEFDREYMKAMVDGHQGVIDKLQTRVDERHPVATAVGKEPKDVNVKPEETDNALKGSLNSWAADTLPVAKGHLERAKTLNDNLKRGQNNTASR